MRAGYWLEILKKRGRLEDLGVNGRILKWTLNKNVGRRCIRLIWLSTGTTCWARVNTVMELRAP